jgi:hypothetical protein
VLFFDTDAVQLITTQQHFQYPTQVTDAVGVGGAQRDRVRSHSRFGFTLNLTNNKNSPYRQQPLPPLTTQHNISLL